MKKIKALIKRKYNKLIWYYKDLRRKKNHIIYQFENTLFIILNLIASITIFTILLTAFEIISVSFEDGAFHVYTNSLKFEDFFEELCIAQISTTFLTTAVLSLISSVDNKYIFGEKATDLIFGKHLGKYYVPIIILYFSMIVNIIFTIKKSQASIFLLLFILSILTLIYIVNKVGGIFLSTKKYKKRLYIKYYNEIEKNIDKRIAPRNYDSDQLINLKNQTIQYILEKDTSYVSYISMYKELISSLLFNKAKELQEYHLDMEYAPSIVNDFIEIINHFIYVKDYDRTIQYYNWLLAEFNYHNVYICYNNMSFIFDSIISKLLDFKNEFEVIEYLNQISSIITDIELQQYYAITNDYSYTKLNDLCLKRIYFYNSNYFEKIYDNIYNNKYLSKSEKSRCYAELFDIFRMSGQNGCNFNFDINTYSYEFKEGKDRVFPSMILGQATTLLLLRTLYNKDRKNFDLFVGMNLEEHEMCFAIHTLILTLMHIEEKEEYQNLFSDYCGLDIKWAKDFIKRKIDFLFKTEDIWINHNLIKNLQEDYDYISENCVKKENQKNMLFLNYLLKYEPILIEEYFTKIATKFNVKLKNNRIENKDYEDIIKFYFE